MAQPASRTSIGSTQPLQHIRSTPEARVEEEGLRAGQSENGLTGAVEGSDVVAGSDKKKPRRRLFTPECGCVHRHHLVIVFVPKRKASGRLSPRTVQIDLRMGRPIVGLHSQSPSL